MSIQQNINQLLGLAGVTVGLAKRVYKAPDTPTVEEAEVEASKETVKTNTQRYQDLLSYHTTARKEYNQLYGSLPDVATKEDN